MTTPVPQPPTLPFLGNVTLIDKDLAILSFELLAAQYGEIFNFSMLGRSMFFVNTQKLVNDVSDESRFAKIVDGALSELRNGIGDGLFTWVTFAELRSREFVYRASMTELTMRNPIGESLVSANFSLRTRLTCGWS